MTTWGAKNWTLVGHVQGKLLTHCTIPLFSNFKPLLRKLYSLKHLYTIKFLHQNSSLGPSKQVSEHLPFKHVVPNSIPSITPNMPPQYCPFASSATIKWAMYRTLELNRCKPQQALQQSMSPPARDCSNSTVGRPCTEPTQAQSLSSHVVPQPCPPGVIQECRSRSKPQALLGSPHLPRKKTVWVLCNSHNKREGKGKN